MNIHEVAQAAGVSVATVSRVVNHPELVAEKTRARVLAVLEQKRYAPNAELRTRSAKRKQAIALVIPSLMEYRLTLDGVRQIGNAKNYGVQLCVTDNDEPELIRNVRALAAQQIDGVILAGQIGSESAYRTLREAGIPVVCINSLKRGGNEDICYINYGESAGKLAQYAVESGNRSAVLILSDRYSGCREKFEKGFRETWYAAGLPEASLRTVNAEESFKGGAHAMEAVLTANVLPDLIVAQYDEMAIGAMKAAQEQKISIPKQLRFMGFFDTPVSSAVTPELTSIEQPTYRLGVASARRLFDIMEDQDYFDVESQEIVLKGRLKIRRSCGNKKTIYELYD
ncbi:MAG: LacI family DNA-binding transcriptional regulator [Clostridia bacterium]|nr:LacI family DNA-binding transcriptional regulator [Clostridia bacterium]